MKNPILEELVALIQEGKDVVQVYVDPKKGSLGTTRVVIFEFSDGKPSTLTLRMHFNTFMKHWRDLCRFRKMVGKIKAKE